MGWCTSNQTFPILKKANDMIHTLRCFQMWFFPSSPLSFVTIRPILILFKSHTQ
jgi:hypothetical protein